jgi:hypothetical protein
MMSSTLESDEPSRSTDTQREIALLAFEKEFDGIRRAVVRAVARSVALLGSGRRRNRLSPTHPRPPPDPRRASRRVVPGQHRRAEPDGCDGYFP